MNLAFRQDLNVENIWTDPRGLSGSELGCIRIAQELRDMGHAVTIATLAEPCDWDGIRICRIEHAHRTEADAVVAINDPNALRGIEGAFRVVLFWNNDFGFCRLGFDDYVDLWQSPSQGHLDYMLSKPFDVELTHEGPRGTYRADPSKWTVNELGCDPERYGGVEKVPGRVVYCSSPDRGLHWLLQEWPAIKRAVPHAHLRIFYRLEPWIRGFDNVPYFPPIEPLRARALYIEDALRRLAHLDVVAVDSVSREQIAREMSEAEVLAFPCDTVSWSEGFSCTVLEACAARACPVITDCDAFGTLYGGVVPMASRELTPGSDWTGWVSDWSTTVIEALEDSHFRSKVNEAAHAFAQQHTWRHTAQRLASAIEERINAQ